MPTVPEQCQLKVTVTEAQSLMKPHLRTWRQGHSKDQESHMCDTKVQNPPQPECTHKWTAVSAHKRFVYGAHIFNNLIKKVNFWKATMKNKGSWENSWRWFICLLPCDDSTMGVCICPNPLNQSPQISAAFWVSITLQGHWKTLQYSKSASSSKFSLWSWKCVPPGEKPQIDPRYDKNVHS